MNRKRFLSILAAVCVLMTACAAENDTVDIVSETESVTQSVVSYETVSETTTVSTVTTIETTETTEVTEASETIETAETVMTEKTPEKVSVNAEDMSFTDFTFIEYYKGTKESGEIGEKAIDFFRTTPEYRQSQDFYDTYKEKYPEYFDENGVLVPKFHESFTEDFDGDGKKETFLLIDIPYSNYVKPDEPTDSFFMIYSFLIYTDNEGHFEILMNHGNLYAPQLLDYGTSKQLVIGGSGSCGAEDGRTIFGVKNNRPVSLYGFRGSVTKQDCFVSVYGWQSRGGTMLFEPKSFAYIPVDGVLCDKDEIKKMDKNGVIKYLKEDNDYISVRLIGGKYYCVEQGLIDTGLIYTYSDGGFVPAQNIYVRNDRSGLVGAPLIDFNYDDVISKMTKVKSEMPSYSAEDLDEYTKKWLKEKYAEFISNETVTYTADDVKVTAFYGIYGGHEAVTMSPGTDEILLFVPYDFDYEVSEKKFVDIETAYRSGIISEISMELLNSVLKKSE